jgi:predicted acylesterase/phospholipase RssA
MSAEPTDAERRAGAEAAREHDRPQPLDENDPPPVDRYCDLVLTGGVADGVIYPWAILEIARAYRFKNIGGTSVGAIAAALAAAAEYSRRRGHHSGFNEVLRKLPGKLAEKVDGNTRLYSLFQPERSTRRLFELFVGLFSPKSETRATSLIGRIVRRIANAAGTPGRIAHSVLRAYKARAFVGTLLGVAIAGLLAALWWLCFVTPKSDLTLASGLALVAGLAVPCALLGVLLLVGCGILRDAARLVGNNYGLCRGCRVEGRPDDQKALVEWLHEGIQGAARRRLDEPLTFSDLWKAPAGPIEGPMKPALPVKKPRSIDLRMITTNLTQGRPYQLPLEDDSEPVYFKVKELRPYFPKEVLKHLIRNSVSYRPGPFDPPRHPDHVKLRELPKGKLPILVAARLSLSFPILFSTVPLWAIDEVPVFDGENRKIGTTRAMRRCQFSDGGICSNFPIHMFDAAVPDWPTFGISLSQGRGGEKHRVWMPDFHHQGRDENRYGFDDGDKPPLRRLLGLFGAIGYSAKDWSDNTTMRMPGVRDRVVRVLLREGQGGLDLRLSHDEIRELAGLGTQAGRALVERFAASTPEPSRSWREHRWVRFNTFLVALRERVEGLSRAAEKADYSERMSDQIRESVRTTPLESGPDDPAPLSPLTQQQAGELAGLLGALATLEKSFADHSSAQPYEPLPTPTLHVRPPV